MNRRGFTLIEMLVAFLIVLLAGTGLWLGFFQVLKADKKIRTSQKTHEPVRIFFIRMEKDLRNAVYLRDFEFKGSRDSLSFPAARSENGQKELLLIEYSRKGKSIVRSTRKLSAKLVKDAAEERVVLTPVGDLEFQFPYLDYEEHLEYHPFWLQKPYYGIPRSIQIKLSRPQDSSAFLFSKLISVPQGRWGHLPEGDFTP